MRSPRMGSEFRQALTWREDENDGVPGWRASPAPAASFCAVARHSRRASRPARRSLPRPTSTTSSGRGYRQADDGGVSTARRLPRWYKGCDFQRAVSRSSSSMAEIPTARLTGCPYWFSGESRGGAKRASHADAADRATSCAPHREVRPVNEVTADDELLETALLSTARVARAAAEALSYQARRQLMRLRCATWRSWPGSARV